MAMQHDEGAEAGGGIIRVKKHTSQYSIVDNTVFNDERLSYGARGLMGYLLTKPDNWEVRMSDLIAQTRDGRDGVRRFVRELIDLGYMCRQKLRAPNGSFRWVTEVFETPTILTQRDIEIVTKLHQERLEAPEPSPPKAPRATSETRRATKQPKPDTRSAPGPYAALKAAYMNAVERRGLNTKMTDAAKHLEELVGLQTTAEEIEQAVDHATNGWKAGTYFALERLPSAVRSLRAIRSKQAVAPDPRTDPNFVLLDRDEQLARVDNWTRQQYAQQRAS